LRRRLPEVTKAVKAAKAAAADAPAANGEGVASEPEKVTR
jgi:hypothetical protein